MCDDPVSSELYRFSDIPRDLFHGGLPINAVFVLGRIAYEYHFAVSILSLVS